MRFAQAFLAFTIAMVTGAPDLAAQRFVAERITPASTEQQAPALVVVLVVDQLRDDYLDRFSDHFGDRGFNLFLRHGARMAEARYEHAFTVTCAGHSIVATGAYPRTTGIIANEWYNRRTRRVDNCVYDPDTPLVGVPDEGRSPRNLNAFTLSDALRLHTSRQSRVITVSGKDRSAIMLGGQLAHAAYWTVDTLFVTSTYYRPDLPDWARAFNAAGRFTALFGQTWDRVLPADAYAHLGPDDEPAERNKPGLGRTFPRRLGEGESTPGAVFVEALEYSPFHNELVIDFAIQAVLGEQLGHGPQTDYLGVSLSANDRVGHAFGPDSHEVMDATIRTDRLLERFFEFLDREVGLANTLIVLTADHGAAPMPEVVNRINPQSGTARLRSSAIVGAARSALEAKYGADNWIARQDGPHIWLDETLLASKSVPLEEAENVIRDALLESVPGVAEAYTRSELRRLLPLQHRSSILLSFDPERSGNVMLITEPHVLRTSDRDGTTHGSPWSYDTNVPILFYGTGVTPGVYHTAATVADIAATLAAILAITPPSASEGRVLTEILR